MTETKYSKNVVTLPIRKTEKGSMFSAGAEKLLGFGCTIIYAFAYEPGITGKSKEPHVHDYDEVIYFIGTDTNDIGDLGAEVQMSIGPNEEEKHTFNKATAVVVPKGLPHCPVVTKKIDRPYLCMAVSLTGER